MKFELSAGQLLQIKFVFEFKKRLVIDLPSP